jgi:acyl-homoserine-lactone acylase
VPPAQPGELPVTRRRRVVLLAAAVVVALLAGSCSGPSSMAGDEPDPGLDIGGPGYSATIRWTGYGIPHIEALDLGSLGFGQGWAITGDRGCELFDQVAKVRGERARWHGAGPDDAWVTSDLAYRSWDLRGRAATLWSELADDTRELMEGYAAGVNAWIGQLGSDGLPAWCAGAPWVRPIDALDLLAVHHDLAMVMSGRTMVNAIGSAAPPGDDAAVPAAGESRVVDGADGIDATAVALPGRPDIGGTAWALGRRATTERTSLFALTADYPMDGELALWENQLTIPDVLDVYGYSLVGLPGVFMGFTDELAWAHVPSPGVRATFHQLDLVPGDPTRFRRSDTPGGVEAMEERVVTVDVLAADGSVVPVERTMYATRFGPVVELPGLAWTSERAWAYGDAALVRPALADQVLARNQASTLAGLEDAQALAGATGWAAMVAVSANGWALYADGAATPAIDPGIFAQVLGRIATDPVAAAVAAAGSLVLDGGNPDEDWQRRGDAPSGLVPIADLPRLQVRDWVVAAGAGEWAAVSGTIEAPVPPVGSPTTAPGARVPLELFPSGEPTSPQARNVLGMIRRLTAESAGSGTPITAGQLRVELFSNQGLLGTQLVDEVVARCRAAGSVVVPARMSPDGVELWEAQEVPLGDVCAVLDRWEGRWNLEDQAPAVWTQFLGAFDADSLGNPGSLWSRLADPVDPRTTPARLAPPPATGVDPVAVALAEASLAVRSAGLDIDDFWRDAQWIERDGERVPLHGVANGWDGGVLVTRTDTPSTSLAPVSPVGAVLDRRTGLRDGGWPVRSGSSALLVVEFGATGVRADGLLAFGQSADPDSPFHVDQAYRFSDRAWRPVLFTQAELGAGVDRDLVVRAPRAS